MQLMLVLLRILTLVMGSHVSCFISYLSTNPLPLLPCCHYLYFIIETVCRFGVFSLRNVYHYHFHHDYFFVIAIIINIIIIIIIVIIIVVIILSPGSLSSCIMYMMSTKMYFVESYMFGAVVVFTNRLSMKNSWIERPWACSVVTY